MKAFDIRLILIVSRFYRGDNCIALIVASLLKIPVTYIEKYIFMYRRVSLSFPRRFPHARFIARISSTPLYSEGKDFRGFRFGCCIADKVFLCQMVHAAEPGIDGRDESCQICAVPNVAGIPPNYRRSRLPYDCTCIKIDFATCPVLILSLLSTVIFMLNFIYK